MLGESELGRFAPLSGVFPSVFVEAVWVAVDLDVKGGVGLVLLVLVLGVWDEGEKRMTQRRSAYGKWTRRVQGAC